MCAVDHLRYNILSLDDKPANIKNINLKMKKGTSVKIKQDLTKHFTKISLKTAFLYDAGDSCITRI